MDKIESLWKVGVRFNQVQFVGMGVSFNGMLGIATERALINKSLGYIEQAKNFAECIVLSKIPEGMETRDKNIIMVGFTLMFKDSYTAQKFLEELKK